MPAFFVSHRHVPPRAAAWSEKKKLHKIGAAVWQ